MPQIMITSWPDWANSSLLITLVALFHSWLALLPVLGQNDVCNDSHHRFLLPGNSASEAQSRNGAGFLCGFADLQVSLNESVRRCLAASGWASRLLGPAFPSRCAFCTSPLSDEPIRSLSPGMAAALAPGHSAVPPPRAPSTAHPMRG